MNATRHNLLRELMKRAGMSPAKLATAAGCSASFINQLLYDPAKPCPPSLARRLALALNIDPTELR